MAMAGRRSRLCRRSIRPSERLCLFGRAVLRALGPWLKETRSMPDVTVTIDGQTVTVPAGSNIVDAAREAAVSVPVFCYHPKMKAVGMCRMCLVEVWTPRIDPATRQPVLGPDGKPVLALMANKLQAGCVTPVSEGMVVKTATERVEFAQRGVLEFLLTSHPLDCPVCDKGGECPLQNLTMEWGPGKSRFDYTDKVHFEKPIPL